MRRKLKIKNKYYGKASFLLFTISILFLFQNCSEDNYSQNNIESELKVTPVVEKLITLGFKKERIQEYNDFYLVEGDLMFSKDIKTYSKNDMTSRHASTYNLVSILKITFMSVYVDASVPSSGEDNWRDALSYAVSDLNNISGSTVHFNIVTSSSFNPDIVIKSDGNVLQNNVIASAGFPSNNNPYNQIMLNLDFWGNTSVSEGSKRYNLVHELGHCIGLRHTNWDDPNRYEGPGSYGANVIPNTPAQDPNSVMNGGTASYSWNGFSDYDLVAIRYLYPATVILPQITASGPDYIQAGTSLFTWSYTGNLANADLDSIIWWYSKGNNGGEAPYAIGWGSTGYFMSVADTYYSDTGNKTSNFKLYFTIRDISGNLYRSADYNIMQKGKYKLENSL